MPKPGKGFIARAALVLFIGTSLIAPLVAIGKERADIQRLKQITYELCMEGANSGRSSLTPEICWDQRFGPGLVYQPFWPQYLEYVMATALIVAVLYLLLWLTGKLAAWIWRGSRTPADT